MFVFGLGANIALARMLDPRDFGIVALGSVLLVFGAYVTDGGLAAALIRRKEPPERIDLEAVTGLQMVAATGLAAVATAVAAAFGDDGLVVAAMLAALPITSLRVAAAVVLERQLLYRPIAAVDLIEALSFYVWALVAVALGFGVWGLATAVVARAVIGVITMARVGPLGFVRPRWSWTRMRPLVGFGAKFQATGVLAMVRDQGLNVGVASIAGVASLGVWNLAYRILRVPVLIITTAARVSYPAMSRVLSSGRDPRAAIERAVETVAVAIAIVLVALVGFTPAALPALVGPGWEDVPDAILWSSLGMMIEAPVVVATIGYLYATDRPGTVARAVGAQALVWFAVALPLVPALGAPAVGVGAVPAAVVLATMVGRRVAQLTGAAILRRLAPTAALATAAGGAGWIIAASGPETVLQGVLGLAGAEALLLGGLGIAKPALLRRTWALAARGARSSFGAGARSGDATAS